MREIDINSLTIQDMGEGGKGGADFHIPISIYSCIASICLLFLVVSTAELQPILS